MKTGFSVAFRISYVFLGLLVVFLFGLWIFFSYYPNNKWSPSMLDVMAYCTGSVAILTLIYHSLNLVSTQKIHKENIRIRRNQYSFEVIAKFHDQSMSNTIKDLREIRDSKEKFLEKQNIEEFLKFLSANPVMHTNMVQLFNYFEHISLLVEKDHVDEKIIKSAFKTLFLSIYSEFRFYIDERQKKHSRSWIKYEELCKEWDKN